jgi:hypothetical protein
MMLLSSILQRIPALTGESACTNQRQRILAAHYLCLLDPGTPLFNTSAPAWRQQRWLAKM